jgi:hypothetical protein
MSAIGRLNPRPITAIQVEHLVAYIPISWLHQTQSNMESNGIEEYLVTTVQTVRSVPTILNANVRPMNP